MTAGPVSALALRQKGALVDVKRTAIDDPGLDLPHPRAAERGFVMGPLAEIAPDWRHPVTGETAAALAERAVVGADARPL